MLEKQYSVAATKPFPKRVKSKQNSRAFAISTGTLTIDAFAGKAFPKEMCLRTLRSHSFKQSHCYREKGN
jgi:hypothetical protein